MDTVTIRIFRGIALTVQCPNCKSSVLVTPPTKTLKQGMTISEMTCTCGQNIIIATRQ